MCPISYPSTSPAVCPVPACADLLHIGTSWSIWVFVVFADFNRFCFHCQSIDTHLPPFPGLRTGAGNCWLAVPWAEVGCSLTSCPGHLQDSWTRNVKISKDVMCLLDILLSGHFVYESCQYIIYLYKLARQTVAGPPKLIMREIDKMWSSK